MRNIWRILENALKEKDKKFLENLNPPASEKEILELEELIGAKLPKDFVDFYKVHNGEKDGSFGLIYSEELLSISKIIEEWSYWQEFYDELRMDNDEFDVNFLSKKWIPFTLGQQAETYFFLDLNEGENYGKVAKYWGEDGSIDEFAKSFREFLEDYVDDVETGTGLFYEDELDDGNDEFVDDLMKKMQIRCKK